MNIKSTTHNMGGANLNKEQTHDTRDFDSSYHVHRAYCAFHHYQLGDNNHGLHNIIFTQLQNRSH